MADQFQEEHAGTFVQTTGMSGAASAAATPEDVAILNEVKEAYKFGTAYWDAQFRAEKEQAEFDGEDMWGEEREDRLEHKDPDTGEDIPGKPTLEIHLNDQTVQQIVTGARQARFALSVKPKAGIANTKYSDYYKGGIRKIQIDCNATAQRLWAFEQAVKFGRGGYEILADYAADDDFDLDLLIQRVFDYSRHMWDPYATMPDNRDANWHLKAVWFSEATHKRLYDKALVFPESITEDDLWFGVDGEHKEHRRACVVTFYKKVYKKEKLGYHPIIGKMLVSKMPPEAASMVLAGAEGTLVRPVDTASVKIYTVDGTQVLKTDDWHGKYIPVIEVVGREYIVRGRRRYKGIIANTQDILRAINVVVSAAVELGAMLPRMAFLLAEGQDTNYEKEWDEMFVTNRSRIHYKPTALGGQPVPPPMAQTVDARVQGTLLLLRALHEMYYSVVGSVAPQARAANPYDRSGEAIKALQAQGSSGHAGFLDNLATVSIPYEGLVMVDAYPHYYDRPGRVINITGRDDEHEIAIMIKRPFIRGKEGEPEAVPCPRCEGRGTVDTGAALLGLRLTRRVEECPACKGGLFATEQNMPEEYKGRPVQYVDFAKGRYSVQPVLDRDIQAQQEEALMGMEALSKAIPQMVPLFAPEWVEAMGFTGSRAIADKLRAQNPLGEEMDEVLADLPPAAQAKFQQLHQQHQQAMQALQEAQKLLDTDAIKSAGQKEIATIRAAMQQQLERLKVDARTLEKQGDAQLKGWQALMQADMERMSQESQQRHEILLQLLKEKGEKEVERHNVALHDQAAALAEQRLGVREAGTRADEEGATVRAEARQEAIEARAGERDESRALRADVRREASAKLSDVRGDASTEAQDRRAADQSERAADREDARAQAEREANRLTDKKDQA